jgi:peptidyl-prolyl cis-trans isomerase A (cyclophilin A)
VRIDKSNSGMGSDKILLILFVLALGIGGTLFWTFFEGERLERKGPAAKEALAKMRAENPPAVQTPPAAVKPAPEPEQPAQPAPAPGAAKTAVPETFRVKFDTTKGDVIAEFTKEWAPIGVERVHELVTSGFFDGCRFFRVIPGFVVQFGIAGDPKVDAQWADKNLVDDPPKQSNTKGTITFAKARVPNTRSTQLFINLSDGNAQLDRDGFAPVGRIVEGMDVVLKFNSQYGDSPTSFQQQFHEKGNEYIDNGFPNLDSIEKATVIP